MGVGNYYNQLSCDCHDYLHRLGIDPEFFYARSKCMAVKIPSFDQLKEGSIAYHLKPLDDGRCAVIEVTVWNSEEEAEDYCRFAVDTGELFGENVTYH